MDEASWSDIRSAVIKVARKLVEDFLSKGSYPDSMDEEASEVSPACGSIRKDCHLEEYEAFCGSLLRPAMSLPNSASFAPRIAKQLPYRYTPRNCIVRNRESVSIAYEKPRLFESHAMKTPMIRLSHVFAPRPYPCLIPRGRRRSNLAHPSFSRYRRIGSQ